VRGAFAPEARCGYRNPTLSSILATQLPERCLSRKAGIVRCCLKAASRPACGNVPRWGGWLLYRGKVEIKKYAFAADVQTAQSMV